ncbi:P-loop containing nucleoside triphosphate hydrolase protein [Kalaharituber pfeilii]|nr:P-loop containing nucleoside triphosphate hydrolase protein [Kalaharituber pfeilii]
MPPKSKKKKLPTRAVMTTSAPSKAQTAAAAAAEAEAQAEAARIQEEQEQAQQTEIQSQPGPKVISDKEAEFDKASLEEERLRDWVEKYGEKCKKESTRYAEKMQSERRILRAGTTGGGTSASGGLVFPLYVEGLLGLRGDKDSSADGEYGVGGIAKRIIELASREAEEAWSALGRDGKMLVTSEDSRGENLVIQAWMMHRVFTSLGFEEEKVERAIAEVVGMGKVGIVSGEYKVVPGMMAAGGGVAGGDMNMGLFEEVLDYLSFKNREGELPRFDGVVKERKGEREKEWGKIDSPSRSATSTPPVQKSVINGQSGAASTSKKHRNSSPFSSRPETPVPLAPSKLAVETIEIGDGEYGVDEVVHMPSEDHSIGAELGSDDIPPEELLPRWVELKKELAALDPSSIFGGGKKKGSRPAASTKDGKVEKLREWIMKIERDPFFDTGIAGEAWAKESSSLKNSGASMAQQSKRANRRKIDWWREKEEEGPPVEKKEEPAPALGDDGLFCGMFEKPQTEEVAQGTQEKITIRDFEKPQGNAAGTAGDKFAKAAKMHANATAAAGVMKVVEEIVKAKDPKAKVIYSTTHGTTYSSRHSLTIKWSSTTTLSTFVKSCSLPLSTSTQIHLPAAPDIAVTVVQSPNPSITFEMVTISATTPSQSQAYISTFALYNLNGGSTTRGGKGYGRLQGVWRDVWTEFVDNDNQEDKRLDKELLQRLKGLVLSESVEQGTELSATVEAKKRTKQFNGEGGENGGGANGEKQTDWENRAEGESLKEEWEAKCSTEAYQHMLEYRRNLPMWSFKEQVLDVLNKEQVMIICGETGCGKSTQVPAFILENEMKSGRPCKVYCAEPRRISAISLARRVSEELGEAKGDLGGRDSLVGYAIRLESCMGSWTRLVYATTGIIMRMLEHSPQLDEITHLVLDEVHERSIDSDFLLIVLKKLLAKRKGLKVILMSATVDAARFSHYLNNAPILQVPGRIFPITTMFLEDAIELTKFVVPENDSRNRKPKYGDEWDDGLDDAITEGNRSTIEEQSLANYTKETRTALVRLDEYKIQYELIVRIIEEISTNPHYEFYSKAILVFLPGIAEIRKLNDYLLGHPVFGGHGAYGYKERREWLIYPLHSTIASEEQEAAFLVPPPGMRKVVLATNIAETGITIPDVTCVIDTGKHKEMRFYERRQMSRLLETFISKANAQQRRGRAGRVQEGLCFHLFTKERFNSWMPDQQTPEMMRLSLQDLVLRVKLCNLGAIEETLTMALDPPSPKNIRRAIDSLIEVKALTVTEELTPLGRKLSKLPLDVYLGKLVLYGWIHGCLDAAVTIAAILSSKSPFTAQIGLRREADAAKHNFKRGDSDLLTIYTAYCAWRRVCSGTNMTEMQFCQKNYLSSRTLNAIEDLKGQLITCIVDAGFLTLTPAEKMALSRSRFQFRRKNFFYLPSAVDFASDKDNVVNSVIAAGFYPKLLIRDGKGWRNIANNHNISIHPRSVNKGNTSSTWLSYYGIMQSSKFYDAHETSHVDEISIALLCGDIDFRPYAGVSVIDGHRIKFSFQEWKSMLAFKILRSRLTQIVNRAFRSGNAERAILEKDRRWMEIALEVLQTKRRTGATV